MQSTPFISGTELEVETLKKYLPAYCHQYFTVMPDTRAILQNYLTGKGDKSDSNTVTLTPYGVTITSDDVMNAEVMSNSEKTDSELTESDQDEHEDPMIPPRKP
jgi:hypothetical protein